VQNPPQEICMHHENGSGQWQRNLPFFNNHIWAKLPESIRESCRALLSQLQAEVLKQEQRRKNERED
jgi:hypothetical protein